MKFIYNSVICTNFKSIKSYSIPPNSTIKVFVPKQILKYFLNPNLQLPPQRTSSDTNNTHPIITKPITTSPNNSDIQINNIINSAPNRKSEEITLNDECYSIVLSLVDHLLLHQIKEAGFNEKDAAYALVYKTSYSSVIDLIKYGVSSDAEYRFHINEIVSGRARGDDSIRHEIEISKLEARKKGENEFVAAAVTMTECNLLNRIESATYREELKSFSYEYSARYQSEFTMKFKDDMESGKKFVIYVYDVPQLLDWRETIQMMNPEILRKLMSIDYNVSNFRAVDREFNKIFERIPQMSDNDFVNPFNALYNDMIRASNKSDFIELMNFARNMNCEQLKMIYRVVKSGKCQINEAIRDLKLFDGDAFQAEQIINSD